VDASLLGKMDFGAVLVGFGSPRQGIDLCSGNFLLCNSSSFFWLCASILPLGKYIVAEVDCNWYLLDINMYSLLKNEG
jgi:hypothetical protein